MTFVQVQNEFLYSYFDFSIKIRLAFCNPIQILLSIIQRIFQPVKDYLTLRKKSLLPQKHLCDCF